MRTIRLFAVGAAVSLAAALSAAFGPAGIGVAHAAADSSPKGEVNMWSIEPGRGIEEECPSQADLYPYGAEYQVIVSGVYIRLSPDGHAEWSISKGTNFTDSWYITGQAEPYQCIVQADGQEWVVGISDANNSHFGWVPKIDLELVKPILH
jgi:hypothetical protein